MKIVETEKLPIFEYYEKAYSKKQIVLHHTVSSTAKSVSNWFKADLGKSKIATAFCVDKDGTVYQLFDPKCWAWHIGKGSTMDNNKASIGIEVVNEGTLEKRGEKFYWFDGKYEFKGEVVKLDTEWRGVKYVANYTKAQIEATHELLWYLFDKFPAIEHKFTNTFEYDKKYLDFNGVTMHVNLRSDKTDLSVAWNLNDTLKCIEKGLDIATPETPELTSIFESDNEVESTTDTVVMNVADEYDFEIPNYVTPQDSVTPFKKKRKKKNIL